MKENAYKFLDRFESQYLCDIDVRQLINYFMLTLSMDT